MPFARTYLDFNATSPLRPQARAAVLDALDCVGNPSSVHFEGRWARRVLEDAREGISNLVNASPRQVIFTSGATEANTTVIGQKRWIGVAATDVEHPSVLEAARRHGSGFTQLPVDRDGRVSIEAVKAWLSTAADGERLVCLQWANNETGVLQPVAEVAEIVAEAGGALHVDAVQAAGRVPIDMADCPISFLTLSSHKIGGPQGVGALVLGPRGELHRPLLVGGGQEHRLRAGTENVAGVAGFAAAAVCALSEISDAARLCALRDRLEEGLASVTPEAVVLGKDVQRLVNTTSFGLAGFRAETLVIAFDLAGVALSAGSACSSGKVGRSHVLDAMAVGEDIAQSTLRVSLGWSSSEGDVDRFLEAWAKVTQRDRATVKVA
jgi:cysteine desulfurase